MDVVTLAQLASTLGIPGVVVFWLLFRTDRRLDMLNTTLREFIVVQTRIVTMLETRLGR